MPSEPCEALLTAVSRRPLLRGTPSEQVDTGWINDENPLEKAHGIAERHDFQTPLDEIDAAARVVDPILTGVVGKGKPIWGKFLKDFVETEW